jgi:hypothetical protein
LTGLSPFGIEKLPADVLAALRTVPVLAQRLQEVVGFTRELPAIRAGLEKVGADTASLNVLPGIHASTAAIEEAMPTLVEVQQHLARLPETMEALDARIAALTELLERLVNSLGTLDGNMAALQESIEPVGRFADRLPGSGRRS